MMGRGKNTLNYALVVSKEGKVFTCLPMEGCTTTNFETKPMSEIYYEVSRLTEIVEVAAGDMVHLALDAEGKVWGWGYSPYGELGFIQQFDEEDKESKPLTIRQLDFNVEITSIGFSHNKRFCMALDVNGKVWSWGANSINILARENPGEDQIIGLTSLKDIIAISVASQHVLVLDKNGDCFTWGSNDSGQLGHANITNEDDDFCETPFKVDHLSNIISIFCEGRGNIVLDKNGKVFIWGRPTGETELKEISFENPIVDVRMGKRHFVALDDCGTVFTWGTSILGECGHGDVGEVTNPTPWVLDGTCFIAIGSQK